MNKVSQRQKSRASAYRRSKAGLIAIRYNQQKGNSKRRNYPPPAYSLAALRAWTLGQAIFHTLYETWVASGYKTALAPSYDRLNDYKPYAFDNMQLMTWQENNAKALRDRRNGINTKLNKEVQQLTMEGKPVAVFPSATAAAKSSKNFNCPGISCCCTGKRKHHAGFKWRFTNDKV